MFLAEEAVAVTNNFTGFDVFTILFTLVIAIGVYRLVKSPKKNVFAIGFGLVCLAVFGLMDILMVLNWFDMLGGVQEAIGKMMG